MRPLFAYSYIHIFINFIFPLILGSLREVTFKLHNASQSSNINIVPGQKLCPMCRNKLSVREQSETDSRNSDVSDEINYIEEIHSIEQDRQDISECFQSVGISPLKVLAQPLSERINLRKRKLNTAFSTIQEKVAKALNVTPEEINWDTSTTEDVDLFQIKAEHFDRLMQLIKEKRSTIKTNREIFPVFTLDPEIWSIKKVANFFVTEYAARKVRSLIQEKGTWLYLTKKREKTDLKI